MNFRQVAQHVTDLSRAVDFYRRQWEQEPLAVFEQPGFAFFDVGGTRLMLDVNAPSALLYFECDDIGVAYDQWIARGAQPQTAPHMIFEDTNGVFGVPGEEWLAFVTDSEGNAVGLMSRKATLSATF